MSDLVIRRTFAQFEQWELVATFGGREIVVAVCPTRDAAEAARRMFVGKDDVYTVMGVPLPS